MSSIIHSENEYMKHVHETNGIILITKPEQSGKTFTMLKIIISQYNDEDDNFVNFIICDNNLLLVNQTGTRVNNGIQPLIDTEGTTYIEFSSNKKKTEHNDYKSVGYAIGVQNIKNVICCCNGTRIEDICTIIHEFNRASLFQGFKFNIWIDEADKFIPFIDQLLHLKEVCRNVTINLFCLTATSEPLFKKYHVINVFPIEEPVMPNYHGWLDNDKKIYDVEISDPINFVEHLISLEPRIKGKKNKFLKRVKKGTKWFIPAKNTISSHKRMAELLSTLGFATLIVNGDGICICFPDPDSRTVFLPKDGELGPMLINIYASYNLHKYPLCITGNICIGRGVTIMSEQFMIDYAVYSNYGKPNEQSQMAGRTKGNIKHFANYKSPLVFTTRKFHQNATEKEEKARLIAKLAFNKYEGQIGAITFQEYNTCDKEYQYVVCEETFETYEDAVAHLRSVKEEMQVPRVQPQKSVLHEVDGGYIVTSKLLKQGMTVEDLTKDDIVLEKDLENIPAGRSISSTNKGSRYLIIPYYEDDKSAPDSVRFQVRHIRFK